MRYITAMLLAGAWGAYCSHRGYQFRWVVIGGLVTGLLVNVAWELFA